MTQHSGKGGRGGDLRWTSARVVFSCPSVKPQQREVWICSHASGELPMLIELANSTDDRKTKNSWFIIPRNPNFPGSWPFLSPKKRLVKLEFQQKESQEPAQAGVCNPTWPPPSSTRSKNGALRRLSDDLFIFNIIKPTVFYLYTCFGAFTRKILRCVLLHAGTC